MRPLVLSILLLVAVPSLVQAQGGRTLEAPAPRLLSRLWTVDASGGGDFQDIQPAIDAALDGDAIRVRPGTYGGFVWYGKGLTLFAEPGPRPSVQDLCVIEAIPQGRTALVRNLSFVAFSPLPGPATLVTARNSLGTVWLEDVRLESYDARVDVLAFEDCSNGVVVRSEVRGPTAVMAGFFYLSAPERVGLLVSNSFVSAYDSLFEGPAGAIIGSSQPVNQVGGVGARIVGTSFFHAAGSSFEGGPPGLQPGKCEFGAALCIPAARGGNGLEVLGTEPDVDLLDCTLTAGPGRPLSTQNCYASGGSVNCPAGPPGSPSVGSFGTIPLPFRSLAVDGAATAGGAYRLVASGEPGDLVYSVLSLVTEGTSVPLLFGVRLAAPPSLLVLEGTIAANGLLEKDVPVPPLLGPAPFVGYLQGLLIDAFGAYLGGASALIVTAGS